MLATKLVILHSIQTNGQSDGAWSRPLYRPKRDRKPSLMMNFITINYLFNFIFGFIR